MDFISLIFKIYPKAFPKPIYDWLVGVPPVSEPTLPPMGAPSEMPLKRWTIGISENLRNR